MKAEVDRADQAGAAETGRNSVDATTRAEAEVATRARTKAEVATTGLMEAVVERGNLKLAYQRVVENQGAAGVDAITVAELKDHLKRHWPTIRARLLAGTYQPQPVRGLEHLLNRANMTSLLDKASSGDDDFAGLLARLAEVMGVGDC